MKKIITPGRCVFGGRCYKCDCTFTYEKSDIFVDFSVGGGESVTCPTCDAVLRHYGAAGTQEKWKP